MQDLANFLQDLKSGFCYYQNKSCSQILLDLIRATYYKKQIKV